MNEKPKFTPGPWTICWATYNGRRCNFHITASPYGSVRPLARTDWKIEWSEVEGDELVANANLMGAAPDLWKALRAAHDALKSYEYGNSSPELAKEIAEFAATALAKAEAGA